ncbi:MAG: thioredoxin family protein [Bacteroidota bacterium]
MIIKVLGSGCANCKTLEQRTIEAMKQMNITAAVEKVTDYQQIASYGIMRTPGLVLDNKIVVQGRVPTVDQIREILQQEIASGIV